jgi:hypothetical protein
MKRTRARRKAPVQPSTIHPRPCTCLFDRPDPDPSDLALTDVEDPCLDEPDSHPGHRD